MDIIHLMCPCRCGGLQAHIRETGTGTYSAAVHCAECNELIKILVTEHETDVKIRKKAAKSRSRTENALSGSGRGAKSKNNDAKKLVNQQKVGFTRAGTCRIMAHDDALHVRASGSAAAHTVGSTPVLAVKAARLTSAIADHRLTDAVAIVETSGHHDPLAQHLLIALCQRSWEVEDA